MASGPGQRPQLRHAGTHPVDPVQPVVRAGGGAQQRDPRKVDLSQYPCGLGGRALAGVVRESDPGSGRHLVLNLWIVAVVHVPAAEASVGLALSLIHI